MIENQVAAPGDYPTKGWLKEAPEASSVVAKQTDDFKLRRELLRGTRLSTRVSSESVRSRMT